MTARAGRLPVVFFGHGSPTNALEDNRVTAGWRRIADSIGRPKAVLCISAHWYTDVTAVTVAESHRTFHDFGRSLPAPLFDCHYPAPGAPAVAERVRELLHPTEVTMEPSRGLDHGAWVVMSKAWPEADMPVVQLSMNARKPDRWHFDIGQKLRPLRDEGVLIAGSGNIVHNLGVMQWDEHAEPYDWASSFNEYVKDCIREGDTERLLAYPERGREAQLSIPGPDHFLPLLYVLGARDDSDEVRFETDFVQYRSLSMTSLVLAA